MIADTLVPTLSDITCANSEAAIESSPADIKGALVDTSVPKSALAHSLTVVRRDDTLLADTHSRGARVTSWVSDL